MEDQLKREKAGSLVVSKEAVGVIQTRNHGNLGKCNESGLTTRTRLGRYLGNSIYVVRD